MEKGKLDNDTLARLVLGKAGAKRPEVLVGTGIGEDCAVLDFGGGAVVISTDPVTATDAGVGAHAVHVACNDVAARGVAPVAVLLTVLLPETVTEEDIAQIAAGADEAARAVGAQIVGGHTEITDAVTRVVVSATAIGRLDVAGGRQDAAPTSGFAGGASPAPTSRNRHDIENVGAGL
ncbi:MAG: hypothetical protein LBR00_04925, partial [Clostridiales Family XIII bacterium]|nr:hypothetical protein [Clostridiales Family XIII bacterium]